MKHVLKKRSQFEIPRSLLQKSIRRGDTELSVQCAKYLYNHDSYKWLYSRYIIIAAEECWSAIGNFDEDMTFEDILVGIQDISISVKDKDAAGLGSIAYYHFTGDRRLNPSLRSNYHVRLVSEGMKRPNDFWSWAKSATTSDHQYRTVTLCERAFRMGGWPWDMSFLIAASYLSINKNPVSPDKANTSLELPLWVAVDKHTSAGKNALRKAAHIHNVKYEVLSLVSFYFESALTNEQISSQWWNYEVDANLHLFNLSIEKAEKIWIATRETVKNEIESEIGDEIGSMFSHKVIQQRIL